MSRFWWWGVEPLCWIRHRWFDNEGGKKGTWWARWRQCRRCGAVTNYRYDYQAGDPR